MGRIFVPAYVPMRPHNQLGHWQPPQGFSLDDMLSTMFGNVELDHTADMPRGSSISPCRGAESLLGGCPLSRIQRHCMVRRPWIQALDVSGYTPDEVKVTTEGEKIIVYARHEYKDGEDYQTSETRRTIGIPTDVNKDKLVCYFSRDGRLVLKAPYVEVECETNAKTSCTNSEDTKSAVLTKDEDDCSEIEPTTEGSANYDTATDQQPQNAPEDCESDNECTLKDTIGKNDTDLEVNEAGVVLPLMDSADIVNVDGKDSFEVKVNLTGFKPEHVSIRCKDDMICIDAKQETTQDGMRMVQEVHRQYVLPREGRTNLAKATLSENGLVSVSVPMEDKQTSDDPDHVEIPIVHNL